MNSRISRRRVLRGIGTAVTLPLLDGMTSFTPGVHASTEDSLPKRMAFIFVPNGIHMPNWTPEKNGTQFELPATLKPLEPFRKHINVLSGLTLDAGWAHGDGPGDHARAASTFLTGSHPYKTHGADIEAGVSVDQVLAKRLGKTTRFSSLEIGCERGAQAGNCDSGYSCAYSANISWNTPTTPLAKEINPQLLFERLFSAGTKGEILEARRKRQGYRRSVLDLISEDARVLQKRLGSKDQSKLDEYYTGVRELEKRLMLSSREIKTLPGVEKPPHDPEDFGEHMRLMADLMVLAFQGDLTRVATFMVGNAGSNRSYPMVDVAEGHHWLSHHENKPEKHEKISRINQFHIKQLAYLLGKLEAAKEGEGTLLDQCAMVYGSGLGDGNRHNHDNLPILQIGQGGGDFQTGRHIQFSENTPLTNLYLSMVQTVDRSVSAFADSTGGLKEMATEV